MQKDKTNAELGKKVHDYLVKKGVEIPMESKVKGSHQDKIDSIKSSFKDIMETMGLDLKDDSLMDTPTRVAKMYMNEIFYGLNYDNFPKCTTVDNKMKYDELVIEKNITCISNCEHHFVVIDGFCHIGYVPGNKVLGLSKLNRIVDFFAKRPQIQERLTEQIYYALQCILETDDIGVIVEGVHYCVKSRGIRDTTSSTITSKMGGAFKVGGLRKEFLALASKK